MKTNPDPMSAELLLDFIEQNGGATMQKFRTDKNESYWQIRGAGLCCDGSTDDDLTESLRKWVGGVLYMDKYVRDQEIERARLR